VNTEFPLPSGLQWAIRDSTHCMPRHCPSAWLFCQGNIMQRSCHLWSLLLQWENFRPIPTTWVWECHPSKTPHVAGASNVGDKSSLFGSTQGSMFGILFSTIIGSRKVFLFVNAQSDRLPRTLSSWTAGMTAIIPKEPAKKHRPLLPCGIVDWERTRQNLPRNIGKLSNGSIRIDPNPNWQFLWKNQRTWEPFLQKSDLIHDNAIRNDNMPRTRVSAKAVDNKVLLEVQTKGSDWRILLLQWVVQSTGPTTIRTSMNRQPPQIHRNGQGQREKKRFWHVKCEHAFRSQFSRFLWFWNLPNSLFLDDNHEKQSPTAMDSLLMDQSSLWHKQVCGSCHFPFEKTLSSNLAVLSWDTNTSVEEVDTNGTEPVVFARRQRIKDQDFGGVPINFQGSEKQLRPTERYCNLGTHFEMLSCYPALVVVLARRSAFQNKSHAGALLYVYIFRHVFLLLIHLSTTNQYEDCKRLNPRHHPCYF